MQMALDALESRCGTNADERRPGGAIEALRAALAYGDKPSPFEPAVWMFTGPDCQQWFAGPNDVRPTNGSVPLYTAPPAAARVPLTTAQRHADELLAALKAINTGCRDPHQIGVLLGLDMARAVLAKIEAAGQEGGSA
jgi:hypothetical protein